MNEKQIFDYLVKAGMTEAGAAGLMGNLIAESGLKPTNLQNNYENSLGMDDETYTYAVDTGMYQNFVGDSAGYGLAQWTYWSRKRNLLDFAKKQGKSIGDCQMQLDFLLQEIKEYGTVWGTLKTAKNIRTASDVVLLQYERPANQSEGVQQSRAQLGQGVYDRCKGVSAAQAPKIQNGVKTRTFSPLAIDFVEFGTLNCNPRKNQVSKITIHHMAGVNTGVGCASSHLKNLSQQASANYYIGTAGDICGGVRETFRSWCSGTGNDPNTNDHMAITIEVSNDKLGDPKTKHGWTVSGAAYKSLIALCADVCTFYGIDPHFDGTPNGTLTMHNQFQNTACPGEQLENLIRSGQVERDIKAAMGKAQDPAKTIPPTAKNTMYRVQIDAEDRADADKLASELKEKRETCLVMRDEQGLFKVQVGSFAKFENAKNKCDLLIRAGYKAQISEVTL